MDISNLLAQCNMDLPYDIYTTNDIIISQAPYIDSCEELETLFESNTDNQIVDNLQNQNLKFLHEHFNDSQTNDTVLDNMLMAILVILAIIMFIFVLPNGF